MDLSIREKSVWSLPGSMGILICLAMCGLIYLNISSASSPLQGLASILIAMVIMVLTSGFVINQPHQALVVQFFGTYMGVIRQEGLRWTLPLSTRSTVSLRLRNFESPKLKVNDADGNPIEIAAIIVWRVYDPAQATFNVDVLEKFLEKQTEAALRVLATHYPYDKRDEKTISLHGNIDEVNEQLKTQVSKSLTAAGIRIEETRISHLAYAPEIAAAMLQRQQAQAIVAARQQIVDGAVGMVEMALKSLTANGIVQLNEDRKAAMVSNLLVVLCSERPSQPVVNAGLS